MKKPIAVADFAWVLPGDLDWPDLLAGRSAVVSLPASYPIRVGAPCPLETNPPDDWPWQLYPRAIGLALAALNRLAVIPDTSLGLVLGMPNYNAEVAYLEYALKHDKEPAAMNYLAGYYAEAGLDYLASKLPGCGPRIRVDSACATGNDSLILAYQWLQSGQVSNCIVLAASAMLTPIGLALFKNLKALNTHDDLQASCPFDHRRSGFVMGEGAAVFWLSTEDDVPARAYMDGYGHRHHAKSFIDLPAGLTAMSAACRDALGDRDQIAYVSAHGTATQLNDLRETQLHHHLFGRDAAQIPLSSVKSMLGHTLGAAALIDAGVCVAALESQIAPPTINLHVPDPNCNLNYIPNKAQPISGQWALSNAFAFGGQHSSVLFSRHGL